MAVGRNGDEGAVQPWFGAPKVGKSALITAMIGALARGDRELLGRPLAEECPPVILLGTDQPCAMWAQLLNREELLQDRKLQWPIERLMAAGDGLVLDDEGLQRIQQMAEEHPGALIVLDSYDSLAGPLGVEDVPQHCSLGQHGCLTNAWRLQKPPGWFCIMQIKA